MQVGDVMSARIVSVEPNATVRGAIARMMEESVGSVAVLEGSRFAGIFTERDVLRLRGGAGRSRPPSLSFGSPRR